MRPALVLASASPRRLELLGHFGVEVVVRAAHLDETPLPGEAATSYVERLAREKALSVARPGELVIGADTAIELDQRIFGKPDDADHARRMLRALSGRTHRVHSGVALVRDARVESAVETTLVTMADLDDRAVEWYLATGEPFDKAGAYAVQGAGGAFVTSVTGSVSNVMGLPLSVVIQLAERYKFELFLPRPSTIG